MQKWYVLGIVVLLGAVSLCRAQKQVPAPVPPMGWNSWDAYGLTIDEAQFRANVDVLAKRLKPAGYEYAVVDEGWYLANPKKAKDEAFAYRVDANGRYLPALNRFASAAGDAGFKPVADYVHGLGLKFGIHIIRGISKKAVDANAAIEESAFHAADAADVSDTCPWNPDNYGVKDNAAGQAWYDSLMQQYAKWGVDYIKVDCIASHPYKGDEIRMIHRAIEKTGRAMVLSLSPGPAPLDKAAEVAANAQLWRISDDIWDMWVNEKPWPRSVKSQFPVIASWVASVKPGNWPDADMLPLGTLGPNPGDGAPRKTRLTHDEQRTLVTLWSIARSPLIVGANLTELDEWTASLLTNRDLIAMNQHGHDQRVQRDKGDDDLIVWTTKSDAGTQYVAVFNTTNDGYRFSASLADYGFTAPNYDVREIWGNESLGRVNKVVGVIGPHGVMAWELRR